MNKNTDKPLESALVWLRRDLRTEDHAALHQACKAAKQVWCAFIFDRDILDLLPKADRRVEFIHDSLEQVHAQLADWGTAHGHVGVGLIVRHAVAAAEIPRLAAELKVQAVYAAHDDEPAALERDAKVRAALATEGRAWHSFKDHVVFERSEVLTLASKPYSVFTPYKNAWLKKVDADHLSAFDVAPHAASLAALPKGIEGGVPSLDSLGFQRTNLHDLKSPSVKTAAKFCSLNSSHASTTTKTRATSLPSKGRVICRCICALARCPSASWRAWLGPV